MSVPAIQPGSTDPAAQYDLSSLSHERPVGTDIREPGTTSPSQPSGEVSRPEPERDFFRDAFNAVRGRPLQETSQPGASSAGEEQKATGAENPGNPVVPASAEPGTPGGSPASTSSQQQNQQAPGTFILTQDEIDRRVQSETDRRIARANRDSRARAEQEEDERLLNSDPYGYAKRVRERKALEQDQRKVSETSQELAVSTLRALDASVLDPMMHLLPAEVSDRLLKENDPVGVPGRGKLASAALGALREHFTAEGVKSARDALLNDQVFIKEVLARYGGQAPEVEHVPAAGPSDAPQNAEATMNEWIRGQARQVLRR